MVAHSQHVIPMDDEDAPGRRERRWRNEARFRRMMLDGGRWYP